MHPRADEALDQFKESEKLEKIAKAARIAAEQAEAEENGEAEPKPLELEVLREAYEVSASAYSCKALVPTR